MASKELIFISLIALPVSLLAEKASDYANRGAQKYIFGQDDAAEAEITAGLQKFPNDQELQQMHGLFRKKPKQPPQDQQQQNQNQKQQQKDQQQQSQDQQSQGRGQQKNEQQKSQNSGPSPSPSPSPDENSPNRNQKGEGEESPSPEPGSSAFAKDTADRTPPAASPSPSPAEGEGSEPSATPSESPEKRIAGQLKEAGEPNSQKQDKTDEIADADVEKDGKMSERQALALLQSMKDEEARVRLDERRAARHVYKDW